MWTCPSFVGFATIGEAQDVASFSRNFSMMSCILTHANLSIFCRDCHFIGEAQEVASFSGTFSIMSWLSCSVIALVTFSRMW